MKRLLAHVEGPTEETFVNELLRPHLAAHGVSVSARLLGHRKARARRGGIVGWLEARGDLVRHLKEDRQLSVTTMVDYYGLPRSERHGWPERRQAASAPFSERPVLVETAVRGEVAAAMGAAFVSSRFVPFVMMHEFEALLFSDCGSFAEAIGRPTLAPRFQEIRDQFSGPEEINDSNVTAPSKRIGSLVPGYSKVRQGLLAARAIGLEAMRSECPHFSEWLGRLERLPGAMTRSSE